MIAWSLLLAVLVAAAGYAFWRWALPRLRQAFPKPAQQTESEPVPVGIWCHGDSCQYWDASGKRWGSALRSSGPLLFLVDDQRASVSDDTALAAGIIHATGGLKQLSLQPLSVMLPDNEPGGIRVALASGYELFMDALGDVADQLSTLAVFLGERARDPSFKPQYLDLRTPGRVYFK